MGKVIFWIVVIFGLLLVARLANVAATKHRHGSGKSRTPPASPMVRCMHCGVFLPGADATAIAGGHVCSDPACVERR